MHWSIIQIEEDQSSFAVSTNYSCACARTPVARPAKGHYSLWRDSVVLNLKLF